MAAGLIHSIESTGLVDGPGIRTVVFLQGCRLRCRYCHNPDMWSLSDETANRVTAQELLRKLLRYRPYYGEDGGVTFSGGEPLLQGEFLREILPACKKARISTCLDTAGCGNGDYDEILASTDLVIFDVKHDTPEGYRAVTGRDPDAAEEFLDAVQRSETPLWIRHVVVPGLTDGEAHLEALERFLKKLKNVRRVELLPYHTLGVPKYRELGIAYPLDGVAPLNPETLRDWNERLGAVCCG